MCHQKIEYKSSNQFAYVVALAFCKLVKFDVMKEAIVAHKDIIYAYVNYLLCFNSAHIHLFCLVMPRG